MVRYSKAHKEATRKRIVKTASERFRRDGIDSVGLAGLMSDARLTHGGFYNHFSSKEDLVAVATANALDESFETLKSRVEGRDGGLEGILRAYLDPAHRDAPETGCAIAALSGELARRPEATRQAAQERIERLLGLIGETLPAKLSDDERERKAIAIFSVMMGALQLARLSSDPAQSDRCLEAGLEAALKLAGKARSRPERESAPTRPRKR